jgi:hypothetical protein
MRARSRLIHLYDKPLRPRPVPQPRRSVGPVPESDWGSVAAACVCITAAVVGFFWIYGAMAHPQPLYIPRVAASPQNDASASKVQPVVLAPPPDMSSAAVTLANSDVPPVSRLPAALAQQSEVRVIAAAIKPKKKIAARHVKPLPPEAAQAYAAATHLDRLSAFGGF